ncbi:ATP-binding cassette domain-containing protein [Streptomyces boninensis]|uniref:ATP-binding cassette domain-containing protein n=1 Tax=Streptomyces boninensis TaxID=2039455 RepID=UPI003B216C8A
MRLHGVGRRYGARAPWVLRGVELSVAGATLVRVAGANGSGKTTLLRVLAGLDAPSAGRVSGRPRTAYVPERFSGELPFTAEGYLVHIGRIHGLRGRVAKARAGEWLERFGAGGHARTPMSELSKGTCQKVAVAQALMGEPELLVLDEAWTGLDQAAREELDRAVGERVAGGGTVVFVDHDPRRLAGVADVAYRVAGGAVSPAAAGGGSAVVIEAAGQPGAALPGGLPDGCAAEATPGGAVRLTVPEAEVNAALRVLLDARPPWRIRSVNPDDPAPGGPR